MDSAICQLIHLAWLESNPGMDLAHEEGGFILRQTDGSLTVDRWPHGLQDLISVPAHADGRRNGLPIIAMFHTHPNAGGEYLQGPGRTDIRAVTNDPNLGHAEYEGEFVISTEFIYLIKRSGAVIVAGRTNELITCA
jgi:hypothetical protein